MASSADGALWRLVRPQYAPGLDGRGARLAGGRWNSPGVAVVYCGSSLALCVLETFVHLPPTLRAVESLPPMTAVRLAFPEGVAPTPAETLGAVDPADAEACRRLGDAWIASAQGLALSVPSAVVPLERNVVLNPAHPDMARVRVLAETPFRFDPRLVRG